MQGISEEISSREVHCCMALSGQLAVPLVNFFCPIFSVCLVQLILEPSDIIAPKQHDQYVQRQQFCSKHISDKVSRLATYFRFLSFLSYIFVLTLTEFHSVCRCHCLPCVIITEQWYVVQRSRAVACRLSHHLPLHTCHAMLLPLCSVSVCVLTEKTKPLFVKCS